MEDNYVFLMDVYNRIEGENISEILEMEGIKVKLKGPEGKGSSDSKSRSERTGIYVPDYDAEEARRVIEVEVVRGDL